MWKKIFQCTNNLLIGVVLHTLPLLEFHIHIMLEIYARDKLILNSKLIELLELFYNIHLK